MMNRRGIAITGAIGLIAASMNGCGNDDEPANTGAPAPTGAVGDPARSTEQSLPPLPPFEADGGFLAIGARVYDRLCLTCHEYDGRGIPGMAPTLRDAPLLLGDDERLILGMIAGINTDHPASIAADTDWPGGMVGMASAMSDQEAAAVITYCRMQWTDSDQAISPEAVRRVRASTETDR